MKHVLVIGDVHGKIGGYFDLLKDFTERYSRTGETYSLQLGDFGFSDTYMQREKRFERSGSLDSENHLFFGGNHDDYDHYYDTAGSLGDFGEVPFIPNSFFVRGAHSPDEKMRTAGHDWWPEEQLDWKRSKEVVDEYIKVKPDHVFTHDAPQSVAGRMFPEKENYNTHTGSLLDELFKAHQPKTWTFGHWHQTKSIEVKNTTFKCLGELETSESQY